MKNLFTFLLTFMVILSCNQTTTENQEKLIEEDIVTLPTQFYTPSLIFNINPNHDTTLYIGDNGTQLHVPTDAFVTSTGEVVETVVHIVFQEYTNAAEIAFSQIPMTITLNEELGYFNSSGMFSISGYTADEQVQISPNKGLSIDYALARKNPDIDFYKLADDSSNWLLVQEIDELQLPVAPQSDLDTIGEEQYAPEIGTFSVNQSAEEALKSLKDTNDWDPEEHLENQAVAKENQIAQVEMPDNNDRTSGTLIEIPTDPGHTYPDIIKGLNVTGFGVYNCDQIYRVKNVVSVSTRYVDELGEKITNGQVVSLIDLNYNGAFSFNPSFLNFNPRGRNVLALFTKTGDLYICDEESFKATEITNNQVCTFTLKNVSNTIKSTTDLAKYLNIEL